jgi:hypothetical protein
MNVETVGSPGPDDEVWCVAPTIMVELPVDYVRTWATDCTIFGSACRAALEREGLA